MRPIYDTKRMRWMRTAFTIAILQWITLAFTVDVWGTPWSFLALMIGGRAALSQARYHPARSHGRSGLIATRSATS